MDEIYAELRRGLLEKLIRLIQGEKVFPLDPYPRCTKGREFNTVYGCLNSRVPEDAREQLNIPQKVGK